MASVLDLPKLMRYSAWANATLYQTLDDVPLSVLVGSRPGRPAGLIATVSHLCAVDRIWKAHLENTAHGFTTRQLDPVPPWRELREMQASLDQWYIDYAQGLSEAELSQVVSFTFVDGGPGALSRGDILLHIVNHKTYHRGYIADMLYESGLRPPTLDLPVFLRDVGSVSNC